ncbi:MAG: ABC transporter permease subunit [Candidatus Latescibacterota bacterium]
MIRILVRKELQSSLLTLRLGAGFVLTVVLSAMAAAVGGLEFEQRSQDCQREVDRIRQDLDEATVWSQVQPSVVFMPQPLSVFCRGVDRSAGQLAWIGIDLIPASLRLVGSASNDLLKTFVEVDFATVVTVVLSFLAVVLGFDGICGERERGTLAQVLANPVPRSSLVLAKLLGGVVSLWVPLAVAFVLSLLVALASADLALGAADWGRLACLFVLSCLFLAQVFAFSLMVSALVRDSAVALIVCLFGWLVGSVGYMNLLPSFSRYLVREAPYQEFAAQNRALWEEYGRAVEEWKVQHPGPGEAYTRGIWDQGRLRYAHPFGYAWLQQQYAFSVERQLEAAQRSFQLSVANYAGLAAQARLVDRWAILSPFTNYRALACRLAGTTLDDKFRMLAASHRYRETCIQYLRGREAFASRRWFSDDPPDQEPLIPDPAGLTPAMLADDSPFMKGRMAWVQQQQERATRDDRRRLDLSEMPRFAGAPAPTAGEIVQAVTVGLAVLLLTGGAAVLVTVLRFGSYDPR